MKHPEKATAEKNNDAITNENNDFNDAELNKENDIVENNDAVTNESNDAAEGQHKYSGMTYIFKEWIVPVAIALVIVLFLNKYIFILVTVPTGSMEDTIIPGDRLYVNELFNVKDANRGDILVFKSDELDEKRLVKRLIGLPGDTVEVKTDGSVFVNDEKLDEPYAAEAEGEAKMFKVPEGSYLFFGDNRPISYDARYWENPYINESKIIGKAVFRFFPFNRIGEIR